MGRGVKFKRLQHVSEDNDSIRFEQRGCWLDDLAVFSGFVAITAAFATTAAATRVLIEFFRLSSAVLFLLVIFLLIFRSGEFRRFGLVAFLFSAVLIAYGFAASLINNSFGVVEEGFFRDCLLILAFVYVFSRSPEVIVSQRVGRLIVAYGAVVLFLTVSGGGLEVSYPPKFNFEYNALYLDRSVEYSQGISKFYGFIAVVAAYLSVRDAVFLKSASYAFVTLLFLGLSVLGGARGDSVAAALIALGCMLVQGKGIKKIAILVAISALIVFFLTRVDINDLVFFSRLKGLDGGLGAREVLYSKGYELIASEAMCSIFGCGFGYYQHHFALLPSYYPHNFFIELAIVYGVPISVTIILFSIYGLFIIFRKELSGNGLFLIILLFFFLIQLKSGTLLNAWWLMAGVSVLCAKSLCHMVGSR